MTNATVFQVSQIGLETTPGTLVPANHRLQSVGFTPAVNLELSPIRPTGSKFPIRTVPIREWVVTRFQGNPAYEDLTYFLSGILSKVTPTNGGDGSYDWTFTPSQSSADTVATYSLEIGSPTRAGRFNYGLVNSLELEFSREGLPSISGEMIGRNYEDNITMTSSPTFIPIVPIVPEQVDVYLDSTYSDLGSTKLDRNFRVRLALANRFRSVWPLDSDLGLGYRAHVESGDFEGRVELLLQVDTQGMSLLESARDGDTLFMRVEAIGPLAGTTNPYKLWIDAALGISEIGEFADHDGVYAIQYTGLVVYDSSWGKAIEVNLTNTRSSL